MSLKTSTVVASFQPGRPARCGSWDRSIWASTVGSTAPFRPAVGRFRFAPNPGRLAAMP